jgi:hypothetical protein
MLLSIFLSYWATSSLHFWFEHDHSDERNVCNTDNNDYHFHNETYASYDCPICVLHFAQVIPDSAVIFLKIHELLPAQDEFPIITHHIQEPSLKITARGPPVYFA